MSLYPDPYQQRQMFGEIFRACHDPVVFGHVFPCRWWSYTSPEW